MVSKGEETVTKNWHLCQPPKTTITKHTYSLPSPFLHILKLVLVECVSG